MVSMLSLLREICVSLIKHVRRGNENLISSVVVMVPNDFLCNLRGKKIFPFSLESNDLLLLTLFIVMTKRGMETARK